MLGMGVGDPLGAFFHCHSLAAFPGGCLHDVLPGHRSQQRMRVTYERGESLAKNQAAGYFLLLRYLQDVVPVQRRKLTWSDTTCS